MVADRQGNRHLADHRAITDQLYSYCRSMDRMDAALGYTVWHAEARVDYGSFFQGSGIEFIDWVCRTHSTLLAHSHQLSNVLIKIHGDNAASESYVTATLRYRSDGRQMQTTVHGRYVDRWSRRDGRWAIDHRKFLLDFDEVHEVTSTLADGWGRRDREDPSYAALNL